MRTRVGFLVVVVLAGLLATAAPASAETRYLDEVFSQIVIRRDIKFGEAPDRNGDMFELYLDLYLPVDDTATDRGMLIWAHGSGFRFGDKSQAGPSREYARRGWVVASIDYRKRPDTVPANTFIGIVTNPATLEEARGAAIDAQHDMQAAVRWARAHAEELAIDADRIAVGGISAGGIIALMTAFNPGDPGSSGTPGVTSEVAAAISHAGAYVPGLQGAPPGPGAPPVAMYHGTSDEQVPFPTSPPGCVLTLLMGNDCEYVTFVGRDHTILGTDLAQDFLYRHVIQADPAFDAPTRLDSDDEELTARTGVEAEGTGLTTGAVVPLSISVVIEHLAGFIRYQLGGLLP